MAAITLKNCDQVFLGWNVMNGGDTGVLLEGRTGRMSVYGDTALGVTDYLVAEGLVGDFSAHAVVHRPPAHTPASAPFGRSHKCPCGSGRRYKNCCGR